MTVKAAQTIAIVGTDTAVGKTLVAGAILRLLAGQGGATPFKPAETGCDPTSPPDGLFLLQCANLPKSHLDQVVPFRFTLPASPLTASARQRRRIDQTTVMERYRRLLHQPRPWVVMEGAGGLLVPFGEDWTFADLLVAIRPKVILVARTGLGTMNHTLLTASELSRRDIHVLGLVFNQLSDVPGPEEKETPEIISRFANLPILGRIPYLSTNQRLDPVRAADIALAALDPPRLSKLLRS